MPEQYNENPEITDSSSEDREISPVPVDGKHMTIAELMGQSPYHPDGRRKTIEDILNEEFSD